MLLILYEITKKKKKTFLRKLSYFLAFLEYLKKKILA